MAYRNGLAAASLLARQARMYTALLGRLPCILGYTGLGNRLQARRRCTSAQRSIVWVCRVDLMIEMHASIISMSVIALPCNWLQLYVTSMADMSICMAYDQLVIMAKECGLADWVSTKTIDTRRMD